MHTPIVVAEDSLSARVPGVFATARRPPGCRGRRCLALLAFALCMAAGALATPPVPPSLPPAAPCGCRRSHRKARC